MSTPSTIASKAKLIRGWPLFGVLPDILGHPAEYCRKMMIEHNGALVKLNLGGGSFYLVTKPEHVQHILADNSQNYWKGRMFNRMRFVFGGSLLLSEGEQWKKQRRLMQPAFSPKRIRTVTPLFGDLMTKRLARWEHAAVSHTKLNIADEMRSITMQMGAAAMFSTDFSEEVSSTIADGFEVLLKHAPMRLFTFFLPDWAPLPGQRGARKAIDRIDQVVASLVEQRRNSPGDRGDLLSLIIEAADEEGQGADKATVQKLLRDHVVTTLFGGYESTATALTWLWCLLSQHPEIARRVREEVEAVIGSHDPTHEELAQLTYTDRVIEESLRLYPPFWSSFRSAYEEDVIDGTRIPAGSSFVICPYATQRDPSIWPNPDAFDPERFSAANSRERHRYAYFPFLEGQRACIGKNFAMTEMKLVVAMAIRRYQLDLLPGYVLDSTAGGTVRPRHTPWMTIRHAD